MISLLYKAESAKRHADIEKKAQSELMLDEAFSPAIENKSLREAFISVLSSPLTDAEDIIYRQEIMRDIINNRVLFDELYRVFGGIYSAVSEYNASRRQNGVRSPQNISKVEQSVNVLQPVAMLASELLTVIRKFRFNPAELNLESEGLKTLCERLYFISASKNTEELIRRASLYINFYPAEISADIAFSIDENARLYDITLLGETRNAGTTSSEEPKARLFFKSKNTVKKPDETRNFVKLSYTSFACERIVSEAVSGITDSLIGISNSVLSEFSNAVAELDFYLCACKVYDRLKSLGVNVTFPLISDETRIINLYDMYLTARNTGDKVITPNDFIMCGDRGGMLIYGDNGSGKTTYIRSVTTAYLMTQAGLFIAAGQGNIRPVSDFRIIMASSENTLGISDDAGRFEEEVRSVAETVRSARPGMLVMLNEVFQTTAYGEGSEGLHDILKYFSARSAQWICVTHLRELLTSYAEDKNVIKITIEGHKATEG